MTQAVDAMQARSGALPGAFIETVVFTMLGAANGFIAWNTDMKMLCFAPLVIWLWAHARNRWCAAAAVFGYCMAYQRDIPQGASLYFGPDTTLLFGVALCVAIGVVLALPWLLLWPKERNGYAWRVPLALAAVTVPPIGIVGGANPLMAAGALFPATGWIGFGLTFCIALTLAYSARAGFAFCLLALLAVSPYGAERWHADRVSAWKGTDTHFKGIGTGQINFMQAYSNNMAMIQRAVEAPANSTLVFPESVAGLWTPTTAQLWESNAMPTMRQKHITALIGAAVQHEGGEYDNAVIAINDGVRVFYKQRIPIPIAMWTPYAEDGARAYWMDDGIAYIGGKRAAVFICYEQLLMWPALRSFAKNPDVIIAPANAWMNVGTSVPNIQKNTMRAWSRLFDLPLVTAFNY